MRKVACVLCGLCGVCVSPSAAFAHVKWFAPFQTAEAPVPLMGMSYAVWGSVCLVTLGFWVACYAETRRVGKDFLSICGYITGGLRPRLDDFLRGATAVFFGALSVQGGIILTPELKCTANWVSVVQDGIAVGMFWRWTLPLSALGILALLVHGGMMYGAFHMLDYPVFLGLAAFFILLAVNDPRLSAYRYDVLRASLALSLMWAGVEKWAYPHWTGQILQAHPHLALGHDLQAYVAFAGAVEFGLAFSLLWTPAVRCAAALVLALMMGAAVIEFGRVDGLGHLPVIVVLLAVVTEGSSEREAGAKVLPSVLFAPVAKGLALVAVTLGYSAAHQVLVAPQSAQERTDVVVAREPGPHHDHVPEALAQQVTGDRHPVTNIASPDPQR